MKLMFDQCFSLISINISHFNTSIVTKFYYYESLTSIDISSFNTPSVREMNDMFYHCSSLTYIVILIVLHMGYMCFDCSSLISINISNFNTPNVIKMYLMFSGCSSLTSINISIFNAFSATIENTLNQCSFLTSIDLLTFNTNKLAEIDNIFNDCSKLSYIDISTFHDSLNYEHGFYKFKQFLGYKSK